MNPIVHFEIPARDMERAKKFYSDIFGWNISKFEGDTACNENYYNIEQSKDPIKLCGGMLPKMSECHNITIYIGVSSVDDYAKKVEEGGGKICVPKMAVPGMGYFVCCIDTEGNSFAIWEEDKDAKPTEEQIKFSEKNEKGTCSCGCGN